ncbi:sigma factor-like helix-turn-helix DNA-binding protein [Lysinibacillus sp. NPDC093210]|uniref:sigma factor-like helix-turn-helix DNA-binding protein n=1 Tax=Lysinibacillus sp. NPDC093210 TaxID=3364133 RepID=UPI00380AF6C5
MSFHFNFEMLNSSLFKNFLKNHSNNKLFTDYLCNSTDENKDLLDKAFKKYVKKAIAVSYLKKVIHYESRRFDKNIRKKDNKELLILDELNSLIIASLKDIEAENKLNQIEVGYRNGCITNQLLGKAIYTLSERQQKILYFYYVLNLSDIEIAAIFDVSQQAISKSRKHIISKLRRVYVGRQFNEDKKF